MNAPDPFAALLESARPLPLPMQWTQADMDAAAAEHERELGDEYQRDAIAGAQDEPFNDEPAEDIG